MIIDIIIPCYNRAGLLGRAIESVLKQTYQQFQLYIIDDGSTDHIASIMGQYRGHSSIHYLKQENGGVSSARNLGIRSSNSPWIAFLDSDDEWLPHKLETQVNFLAQNPNYRFIHSNELWFRHGVRVNPKIKFDKSNHEIFRRSLELCLISPSTVMMKRELAMQFGGFDENFVICEDYDLWLKVLAQEDIGFISESLVKKYGGHADQLSTKYPAMDYWRIRSMVNLILNHPVDKDKGELIKLEIQRKTPVLLSGYLKHGHQDKHSELTQLLQQIWPSKV